MVRVQSFASRVPAPRFGAVDVSIDSRLETPSGETAVWLQKKKNSIEFYRILYNSVEFYRIL